MSTEAASIAAAKDFMDANAAMGIKPVEQPPLPVSVSACNDEPPNEDDPSPIEFNSGAKRSERVPAYRLIPPTALKRLAQRYALGAEKYGESNWLKGINDPQFVQQILDHLAEHVANYTVDGSDRDDNLAAIMWGCAALMVVEELNPAILDEMFSVRRKTIAFALQPRKVAE
jgi:hypothetical protein